MTQKTYAQRFERMLRDFRDQYFRNYKDEKLPDAIFDKALPKYSISFCTTCMNRFFHLKKTFLNNVENNKNYPNVEFVLLNYNSQDELHDWATKNLPPYIERGLVNYYHTTEPKSFHASKAKNLAHKVAKGEILCNLDGDNFTGKDFAFYINHRMQLNGIDSLLQFKKAPYWGTEGRVVLAKKYFIELGGYDEALEPTGHEDHDLMDRGKALGLRYENIQIENFLHYLSNTTVEKAVNVSEKEVNFYDLESKNRKQSKENIEKNILKANLSGWGETPLYKNFGKETLVY
ncbi:MAG TPA: glycosyltransferase family A protein [Chryseolinea sp.]|nr:glycosyltransferase family A protein [Chryseolinea sp.]HPM31750.1 glycosyltransferase family A protein [Chryseolinea sp.]